MRRSVDATQIACCNQITFAMSKINNLFSESIFQRWHELGDKQPSRSPKLNYLSLGRLGIGCG